MKIWCLPLLIVLAGCAQDQPPSAANISPEPALETPSPEAVEATERASKSAGRNLTNDSSAEEISLAVMAEMDNDSQMSGQLLLGNGTTDSTRFEAYGALQAFSWAVDPGVWSLSFTIYDKTGYPVKVLSPGDVRERIGTVKAYLDPGLYYLHVICDGKWGIVVIQGKR